MKRIIIMLAGTLLATGAHAQNLTKAQEGRVAVANCYGSCGAGPATVFEQEITLKYLDVLLGTFGVGEYAELENQTASTRAALIEAYEGAACVAVQESAREIDRCRARCVDLERAYGISSAYARTRFLEQYSNTKLRRDTNGLWVDYRNSPDPDTQAFDTACRRFFDD